MKSPKSSIGGFFELESDFLLETEQQYHQGALSLSTGRSCLHLICTKRTIKKIFVPFYTCDALLQPLLENKIDFEFYSINKNLELAENIKPGEDEYIVYINYFGIKTDYSNELIEQFGEKLILDNTQSFFTIGNSKTWSFNSARKFFGVPDGAYLYGPELSTGELETNPFYQCNHLLERKFGDQQLSYEQFSQYERSITAGIYKISNVANWLLHHLDMEAAMKRRRANYKYYAEAFGSSNRFAATIDNTDTPFCYPLWLNSSVDKKRLHQRSIFVPTLWTDVLDRNISGYEFEKQFAYELLPLPVDHRYDEKDCERVVHIIQALGEF
ncbi:MAG: hypothetical protein EOO10_11690 [Chitinophagaceae bacterium]|nr:MAG: hypothetical protein EOO10_11690 [Chitinophagaceae bacterium]